MTTDTLTPRDTPLQAGDKAPDFALMDTDRNEVSLSDLLKKGGDVVLSFYPFAFTGVCTKEMECFSADHPKFADKNATVVGVSCDSFAANDAFKKSHKIDIPLLSDIHREVCKAYGVHWKDMNVSQRATFVIAPDGKIKYANTREPGDQIANEKLLSEVG